MDYLNKADALKLVKSIGTRSKNLDKDIHLASMSGANLFVSSGDLTVLSNLAKCTASYNTDSGKFDKRSVNGNLLRAWLQDNLGISWSAKAYAGEGGYTVKKDRDGNRFVDVDTIDLEDMAANPFYTYKQAKEAVIFDPVKQAESYIKSLNKILEGKSESQIIDDDNREATQALVTALDNYLTSVEVVEDDTVGAIAELMKEQAA